MKTIADRLHALEVFVHEFYKVLVLQMSGSRDDEVPRRKALLVKPENRWAFKASHRIARAENWSSQRMVLPKILREDFVNEVVRIVLIHFDLFQDYAALAR